MVLKKPHGRRLAFEVLECRRLLTGLPFDDSGLAPPGLASTCALPNLPVFNVTTYGAKGDGVTDDTVPIRSALAAAEAAGGGIIYLPAGTYDVCPQQSDLTSSMYYDSPEYGGNLPIFAITTSNIVFIGDGAGSTHLEGYSLGMKDPVTNWYSATPGGAVVRFDMFEVYSSSNISTIQFRSLDICGNAGYTSSGAGDWPANPVTGDGWDITNKCIDMNGPGTINNVLVFNCTLHDFRGEIVYAGGDDPGQVSVINSDIYGTNGSAISMSADVLLSNDTIGGDTPGSDVYNGVENFDLGAPEKTVIQDCSISCSSNSAALHGNGVVYLGAATSSLTVEGSTLTDNEFGILFGQLGSNVTVEGNAFADNSQAMITTYLDMYPGEPTGFNNFLISGNTFNSTGGAFCSQAYNPEPFPNLVIQDNTVTNGYLLTGAFNGPTPNSWSGFIVAGNILGAGATDVASFQGGNNFPIWTDTVRTNLSSSAQEVYNYSGTSGPISVCPDSDLVVLWANSTKGSISVQIDPTAQRFPTTLAAFPVGYTVTFIAPYETNWVIAANPAWNTLTGNIPVGASGVTLEMDAQGLFAPIPTLGGIEGTTLAYRQNAAATPVTATLTIGDPNGATLAGATVQITGNYQTGEDLLSFVNTANIAGSWNAATGELTLSGADTVADYQAALRTVEYVDTSNDPSSATRTVSFQVDDGLAESNVVSRQIAVTPAAILAGIESTSLAYSAGESAAAVTAAITVGDANRATLAGATVQISGNYREGEDSLSFANTANIAGDWNAATGTLTLTGADTLANYQAALQSITYVDSSPNPSSATRIVSFQIDDGTAESNVVTRQITVAPSNYAPALSGPGPEPLLYVAGGAAAAVAPAITVAYADNTTLVGATVQIGGNYQSGSDALNFVNTAHIAGNWNAATGTLALGGVDTVADYQAALRSITFVDTSSDPGDATRTVSFEVINCEAQSNIVTRQIAVDPAVTLGPAAFPADMVDVAYDQTLNAAGGTGGVTLAVSNIQNAVPGLTVPAGGNSSLTIAGTPTAAGTETFTVTATDALGAATSINYSITVNSPPVLAGIETQPLAYTQGDPATPVTAAITVGDADNPVLAGATVWISGNYQIGEDVLNFVNTANIAGTWNAATGALTLAGSDTLADYQAALQTVAYLDTSDDPSAAARSVSFEVSDGLAESNVVSRQITVTPVATWSGNPSGNLSDPANWANGAAPDPAADDLILGGPTATAPVNDFPAGSQFNNVALDGNCTLSGNSAVLDSAVTNVAGNNSLLLPLALGDAGAFQVLAGALTVNGPIDNAGYLLAVAVASGSTATVNAPIAGAGGLSKSGPGTATLSGTDTYGGATVVAAGTLVVAGSDSLPDDGSLIVGSAAMFASDNSPAVAASPPVSNPATSASVAVAKNSSPAAGSSVTSPIRSSARLAPAFYSTSGTRVPVTIPPSIERAPSVPKADTVVSDCWNAEMRAASAAGALAEALRWQTQQQSASPDRALLARDMILAQFGR